MKLVTASGPPSAGKTSVILRAIEYLKAAGKQTGVIKFDCLTTFDHELYEKAEVPVKTGLSGNLCPDHFFISNISDCVTWGLKQNLDMLIIESAGLCNRCSPHVEDILAVCVIDCLAGVNTPKKIGPMLKLADIIVLTKGDIVSQAEREVFFFKTRQANAKALIMQVNGISGQGAFELSKQLNNAADIDTLSLKKLRFSMPAALCSYCLGETRIGEDYQTGNIKKMNFEK